MGLARGGGGLEVGEDGGFEVWVGMILRGIESQVFHEAPDDSFFRNKGFALGAGCEDAVGGVEDDVFDGLRDLVGVVGVVGVAGVVGRAGRVFGQVGACDLEAVEEESGAARVELVGGDAAEDLADGGLDGGAVFGVGELEGGAAAATLAGVEDGAAGGVVVVAELFCAEAGGLAAVAAGEDVAAAVAELGGGFCGGLGVRHDVALPAVICAKHAKEKACVWTFGPAQAG